MQRTTATRHRANVPAVVVGIAILLTAAFGMYYNATSTIAAFRGAFEPMLEKYDMPYFYHAFFIMSGICLLCYVVLLACSIDLLRSKLRWSRLVTFILVLELVYFFAVGAFWLVPTIGHSVAGATGVANGGMMAQFVILLPFWAPLLLWWAKSRQQSRIAT